MDLNILLPVIASLITGFGTWFAARKKNDADINRTNIENADLVSGSLQKTINVLEAQVQNLLLAVDSLRSENLSLKDTIYSLKQEIGELKSTNRHLLKELKEHDKKINRAASAIDGLTDTNHN